MVCHLGLQSNAFRLLIGCPYVIGVPLSRLIRLVGGELHLQGLVNRLLKVSLLDICRFCRFASFYFGHVSGTYSQVGFTNDLTARKRTVFGWFNTYSYKIRYYFGVILGVFHRKAGVDHAHHYAFDRFPSLVHGSDGSFTLLTYTYHFSKYVRDRRVYLFHSVFCSLGGRLGFF